MSALVIQPHFQEIPLALQRLPYGLWIAEPELDSAGNPISKENGRVKLKKAPRDAKSNHLRTNRADSWLSFADCRKGYETDRFSGVGVLLLAQSGIIGVDLDNVSEEVGKQPGLRAWLRDARRRGIYCEKSPSGTGLHLFLKGNLPGNRGRRRGGIEIYSDRRFLTVTGVSCGWGGDVFDAQELVDDLLEIIGTPVPGSGLEGHNAIATQEPTDVATVEALVAWARDTHPSLWKGEW